MEPKKKHGGKRANSGRPQQGKVKVSIVMTPAHYAATTKNRSAQIEQALNKMLETGEAENPIKE